MCATTNSYGMSGPVSQWELIVQVTAQTNLPGIMPSAIMELQLRERDGD